MSTSREILTPTSIRLDPTLKKQLIAAAKKARQSQGNYIATAIEMRLKGTCAICAGSHKGAADDRE